MWQAVQLQHGILTCSKLKYPIMTTLFPVPLQDSHKARPPLTTINDQDLAMQRQPCAVEHKRYQGAVFRKRMRLSNGSRDGLVLGLMASVVLAMAAATAVAALAGCGGRMPSTLLPAQAGPRPTACCDERLGARRSLRVPEVSLVRAGRLARAGCLAAAAVGRKVAGLEGCRLMRRRAPSGQACRLVRWQGLLALIAPAVPRLPRPAQPHPPRRPCCASRAPAQRTCPATPAPRTCSGRGGCCLGRLRAPHLQRCGARPRGRRTCRTRQLQQPWGS